MSTRCSSEPELLAVQAARVATSIEKKTERERHGDFLQLPFRFKLIVDACSEKPREREREGEERENRNVNTKNKHSFRIVSSLGDIVVAVLVAIVVLDVLDIF